MKNKQGFAAISSVLILCAVMIGLVVTATINSIGEGQGALTSQLGSDDLYLVDGCVEDILQKIRDNPATNLTTITRPEGTCNISYSLSGPANWDITVSEIGTNFGKKVRVVFTRGQTIAITSWQEI